jgi:hypothetical protein
MDARAILRRVFLAYVVALGLLGVVTLAWALRAFALENATLATAWFAVAGAGTLLTAALILRYRRNRSGLFGPPGPEGARTND